MKDYAYRDRLARNFIDFISPFITTNQLDENVRLITFSVPEDLIEINLTPVSINLPQPTILVLIENSGNISNFTDHIYGKTENFSSNLRGIWEEFNRVLFSLSNEMGDLIYAMRKELERISNPFLQAIGKAFGMSVSENLDPLKSNDLPEIKELRKIELNDVKSHKFSDGIFAVIIRGKYKIDRTNKSRLDIYFNKEKIDKHVEVSVVLRLLTKPNSSGKLELEDFDLSVLHETDLSQIAKVGRISRNNDETRVLVKIPKQKDTSQIHLTARYNSGYISLPPESINEISASIQEVTFNIPKFILMSKRLYYTDSVVLNSEQIILLDRILELNIVTGDTYIQNSFSDASIENGSLGIWGFNKKERVFQKEFQHVDPVPLIFYLSSDKFYIRPQDVEFEFLLNGKDNVHELRFHFSRSLVIVNPPSESQVLDLDKLSASQKEYIGFSADTTNLRLAEGGTYVAGKVVRETMIIPGQKVNQSITDNPDLSRVNTKLKIPFKTIKENLEHNEAYFVPFITPHSIEVVLASGKTLIHNFSKVLDDKQMQCERLLVP